MRGYAEWLFSETTYYKELTGQGNGTRTLREVDALISKLLGDLGELPAVTTSPTAKPLSKTELSASVGEPYVDPGPKPSPAPHSLEDLAADILTDGARRKIAAAGNVVANAARAFAPSVFGSGTEKRTRTSPEDDGLDRDPLEDDRRALEVRFEALEREAKDK